MSVHHRFPSALGAVAAGLLVAGLGACSDDAERDESSGEVTGSGDENVFDVAVGDCLSGEAPAGDVRSVPVVPCADPHDSEVFHAYTIEGDEFPTPDAMSTITTEQCLPAFEEFVGMPYQESVLEVTTLEPTSQSWEAGDHELLCIIVDPAGGVTGSLEGANR